MSRWVKGRDGKLFEVTHEFILATGEIRPLPADDSTPPKGTFFGSIVIPPRREMP